MNAARLVSGARDLGLAYPALGLEPLIGHVLPCNVLAQEAQTGAVVVSIAAPRAMFALVNNSAVATVAEEADEGSRRVIDAVAVTETL